MTKAEAGTLIARIRKLYMSQSRNYTNADWQMMTDTWYESFKDEKYADISHALTLYIGRGKQFMPNVPDIIAELTNLDEPRIRALFDRLKAECDKLVNRESHIVIDDYGGIRPDPDSPTGYRYVVAESHMTSTYTQADFANMPIELQIYADDIEGLRALHREIESNEMFSYRRFKERMPYVKQDIKDGAYGN